MEVQVTEERRGEEAGMAMPSQDAEAAVSPTKGELKPSDIRQLTIKNLDTGEEFIIGENDPDFEFDTFEIGAKRGENTGANDEKTGGEGEGTTPEQRKTWWRRFFNYIYGSKHSTDNIDEKANAASAAEDNSNANKSKTPFTKLSSFKIRRELGRGAFGRVLLAEAKTDGKLYALKIISKKNMRSSDKRQAKAERDILHAMTLKAPHPFTSGLKFAFQSENNLYLGMDYIPGGNLRELIKKFKYLPEDWVQFYAAELILAISHLHSLNVLYRDIKPHNVMIDAKGHLILIDFGLSKQEISHPRGALSLVGTPDYSAPEVLRTGVQQIEAHNRERAMRAGNNKKKKNPTSKKPVEEPSAASTSQHIGYGKAADWWSLGIMIYEMISGKPTFRGADLRETYQRILYARLEFIPEDRFSLPARQLLEGLIHRDPSQRLGAWDNPPKDIMSTAFFSHIEWDAIYERRQDGPYVAELPAYISAKKLNHTQTNYHTTRTASTASSAATATAASVVAVEKESGSGSSAEETAEAAILAPITPPAKLLVFSPPPMHRVAEDTSSNAAVTQPVATTMTTTPLTAHREEEDGEGDEDGDNDDDNEEDDEEEPEIEEEHLSIRDSVFVSGDNQNKLPDWSYIDEAVLAEYLSKETNKNKPASATKKEKKSPLKSLANKKQQSSSSVTTTDGNNGEQQGQQDQGQEKEVKVEEITTEGVVIENKEEEIVKKEVATEDQQEIQS